MFRRRSELPSAPSAAMPRDVEALEAVLAALEAGVHSELDAHRAAVSAMVEALGLAYGAVWLPVGDATAGASAARAGAEASGAGAVTFRLATDVGELRGVLAASAATPITLNAQQVQWAAGQTMAVLDGASTAEVPTYQRWVIASRAGAAEGAIVPMISGGRIVALQEFYGMTALPFFGVRNEKWKAISRVVATAVRHAVTAAELEETLNDREAVTTVIARVGESPDAAAALHTALETVRSAFGWAYGSYWQLDEAIER